MSPTYITSLPQTNDFKQTKCMLQLISAQVYMSPHSFAWVLHASVSVNKNCPIKLMIFIQFMIFYY